MQRFTGHCAFHTRSAVRASYLAAATWKAPVVWFRQKSDAPDSKEAANRKQPKVQHTGSIFDSMTEAGSFHTPDDLPPQDTEVKKPTPITPSIRKPSSGSELHGHEYILHTEGGSFHTPDNLPSQEKAQQVVTSTTQKKPDSPEYIMHTEAGTVKLETSLDNQDGLPKAQASWHTPDDLPAQDPSEQEVILQTEAGAVKLQTSLGTPDDAPKCQASWHTPDDLPAQNEATENEALNIKKRLYTSK